VAAEPEAEPALEAGRLTEPEETGRVTLGADAGAEMLVGRMVALPVAGAEALPEAPPAPPEQVACWS